MKSQKTHKSNNTSNTNVNKKVSDNSNLDQRKLKGKKSTGQSSNSRQMPDVFNDQNQKQESSILNVKLEGSQSSMRSSIASLSLNASSMLSGKSLIMSKRSSKNKANLKQVIGFGSDEKVLANAKNINKVRLTRYTALSWAPLSLLFQFKRAANIYFLIITIFTFLPFTPKDPSSMIGTFLFVLVLTMLKEAYEDFQRYKTQTDLNSKKAKVLNYETEKFEFTKWEHIKAGMFIRIEKDTEIPADILLLYSSNVSGLIFVDTMALDGETNLKEKVATCEIFDEKTISQISGEMTVDAPNELLDYWEGFVQSPMIPQKAPCTIKNLALRGSFVRNTNYAYGIVVYTGMQTKILKNLKKPPHKVSNVMKKMNQMLYTVFAFQVILILLFGGLNYKWAQENFEFHQETGKSASQATFVDTFLIQMLVFWVAYSHLIPISLYVIIELLKLGQSYLINRDIEMFDKETKSFASCRNSDLIEELGQVEMIFSDKTGTLTMNKMIFKKCQILGDRIGDANPNEKVDETQVDENDDGMNYSGVSYVKQKLKEECRRYYKNVKNENNSIYNYPYMSFVKVLALCHTVVCDIDLETKEIRYQASSPDELALVQGARDFGLMLVSRNHNKLELENKLLDVKEIYKVVAEFPFDSTRKCMSVIVRDQFMRYYLLTKGADSVMLDKINFEKAKNPKLKEVVSNDLSQYSREGLRTLVMAMRQVPEKEFMTFQKIYSKLVNSNSPYKDKKITELYQKMENKLKYVGCTAIEDKLQDGVPQTIAMLIKADIRFWMLTGDKLETAIEIAKSCRIILDGNQLLVLSTNDFEILNRTLDNQIEILGLDIEKKVLSLKNYDQSSMVIAIDGSTLSLVLEDPELEQKFFYVSLVAKSVVCCRVSPKQKADVVSLYKKRGNWVTMSVGDGANDVSMILEANIGIGIKGKEGTQAVRNADYAIAYLYRAILCIIQWVFRGSYFNFKIFWKQILFAIWHGVVCFFVPMMSAQMNPDKDTGQTREHWFHSTITFTVIIHLVSYKLFVESSFWNIFSFIAAVVCVLFYYIICLALSSDKISSFLQFSMNGIMMQILSSPKSYLLIIALPPICLLPDLLFKHGHSIFFPYPGEKIMIEQKNNPHYSFIENQIKGNLSEFLQNVMRKNKSYGQLTSKALSEIEKQSMVSGVLSANSSIKKFGSPNGKDENTNSLQAFDQETESPAKNKQRRKSKIVNSEFIKQKTKTAKNKSAPKTSDNTKEETNYQNRNKLKMYDQDNEGFPNNFQDAQMKVQNMSDNQSNQAQSIHESGSEQTPQLVQAKAKGKSKNTKSKKNQRIDKMNEKAKQQIDQRVQKNRDKGNETAHNLLNESANMSDNEMNNTVSSELLKKKLKNELLQKQEAKQRELMIQEKEEIQKQKAKQKKRQLDLERMYQQEMEEQEALQQEYDEEEEDEEGYYDEEDQETEEEENHNGNQNNNGKQVLKAEMREQSYKERKKRLMDNIKREQQQKRVTDLNILQASYHSTHSNNIMAMSKLDELSRIAESKKRSKIDRNPKRAVQDHLFAPQQNKMYLYGSSSSGTEKNYSNEIPYMINYAGLSDTTTNFGSNYYGGANSNYSYHLPPDRLRSEGHPLEKAKSGVSNAERKRSKKPKKYVEKYREQIQHSTTLKDGMENSESVSIPILNIENTTTASNIQNPIKSNRSPRGQNNTQNIQIRNQQQQQSYQQQQQRYL
eukprot:403362887